MRLIRRILLCLTATIGLHASIANVYVAQAAAGAGDGSSCANAQAASFFNTAGNWGAGGTQIGAGSTVHLCGTISTASTNTNILTFHGSGTSGNPITLKWETGAVVQSPACGGDSGSCIIVTNQAWIVFDGNGTSPSVQNTANGSALANHITLSYLINAQGCSNCEFKNLTLANVYQMTSISDGAGDRQYGISFQGSNVSIHDNVIHDAYAGMDDEYQDGDTNIQIYNNTISLCNWGMHIGNNAATALSNVFIHNNDISSFSNWDNATDNYHHDGVFVVQNNFSASITNVQVYNNYFHGPMTACGNGGPGLPGTTCMTAYVFTNTGFKSLYVYNNLFVSDGSPSYLAEGGISGDLSYNYYNNTFDCGNSFCLNFSSVNGFAWENNIFTNVGSNPNNFSGNTNQTWDYNAYLSRAGVTPFVAQAHGVNSSNLNLSASYTPNAGSPVIGAALNLTSLGIAGLNVDKNGAARPAVGAWDAGAYQFSSSTPPTIRTLGTAKFKGHVTIK